MFNKRNKPLTWIDKINGDSQKNISLGKAAQSLDRELIELIYKIKDLFQTKPPHQTCNIPSSSVIYKNRVTQEELIIKSMMQAPAIGLLEGSTYYSRMIKLHKNQ